MKIHRNFARSAALLVSVLCVLASGGDARAQGIAEAMQAAALRNYKPLPIPKGPEAKTHIQFMRAQKAWEHGLLKQGFDKIPASAPWKGSAGKLLAIYAQLDAPGTWEVTPEIMMLREDLLNQNCADPYVQYVLGMIGEWTEDKAEMARGCKFMADAPAPGIGGDYLLMKASFRVFDGTKDAKAKSAALAANMAALKRLFEADIREPDVDRYVFRFIADELIDYPSVSYSEGFGKAVEQAAARKTWLVLNLLGILEIDKGFNVRGTGFADTVTEEGMRGFHEHAQKARELLTAAWQLAPDRPESAAKMIEVAVIDSALPREEMRLWFDRSVAAEMDCQNAYGAMEWGLRPRWHGDRDEGSLYSFGKEAMGTGRYDSQAPLFYLKALMYVGEDMPGDLWRIAYRLDNAPERLKELVAGYEKTTPSVLKTGQLASLRVLAADWSGNYDDASVQLQKMKPDAEFEPIFKQGSKSPTAYLGRSRSVVQAEIRAFTGPQRETLRQAEKLEQDGKISEATARFEQAYQAAAGDEAVHGYLRDRIALALLKTDPRHVNLGSEGKPSDIFLTAINSDSQETIDFLLANGFDLKQAISTGYNPLALAAEKSKWNLAKQLIEKGADPNSTGENGFTALLTAVGSKNPEAVAFLLDRGGDLKKSTGDGRSALHLAATNDDVPMIDLLLKRGSDIDAIAEKSKQTPLDSAIGRKSNDAVARLRVAGAKSSDPGILCLVVAAKDADLAGYLLDHGANASGSRSGGDTPLHVAAISGDVPMIDLLLKHGADVNIPNAATKITPLDAASIWKRTDAINRLQAAGGKRTGNVSGTAAKSSIPAGWTALHQAALKGDAGALKSLIAKGLDVDAMAAKGMTPLHAAVFSGNAAVVEVLVAAGAKAKPLTEGGWSSIATLGLRLSGGRSLIVSPIFKQDPGTKSDDDRTPVTSNSTDLPHILQILGSDPDWKAWAAGKTVDVGLVDVNTGKPVAQPRIR